MSDFENMPSGDVDEDVEILSKTRPEFDPIMEEVPRKRKAWKNRDNHNDVFKRATSTGLMTTVSCALGEHPDCSGCKCNCHSL